MAGGNGKLKKVKPAKMGRPSKFEDFMELGILEGLYREGFTDKQVAKLIGVSEVTINNWKNDHPDFFKSLKDWKAEADHHVVNALYKSALGYTTKHKKAVVVSDGNQTGSHVEYVHEEHQMPPNATSIIFWLKNRHPDQWSDKKDVYIKVDLAQEISAGRQRVIDGLRANPN